MAIDWVNTFSLLEEVCFYLTGITVYIHHSGLELHYFYFALCHNLDNRDF